MPTTNTQETTMTNYRINQLGSQIKNGTARIVGRTVDTGLDDATYIVEDLERLGVEVPSGAAHGPALGGD